MPITHRRLYSVGLLLAYILSFAVVAQPHFELDFLSGSGRVQLSSHADAAQCRHLSLSHKEHCILCSTNFGRSFVQPASNFAELRLASFVLRYCALFAPPQSATAYTFSLRAPPSIHAVV